MSAPSPTLDHLHFQEMNASNVEAFKAFFITRMKEENAASHYDYEALARTVDADIDNGSVTFLAYIGDTLVGSLKCDDTPATIAHKASTWGVNFSRLQQLGGVSYLGRYCLDYRYITNTQINQGLFRLAIAHALSKGNYFLLMEGVARNIRLYERLGFRAVLPGKEPVMWLEVAMLCPMISNIARFIVCNKAMHQSFELDKALTGEMKVHLDRLATLDEVTSLSHDDMLALIAS